MAGKWQGTKVRGVYVQTGVDGKPRYKAVFRDRQGVATSKTFSRIKDAGDFLAEIRLRRRTGDLPDRAKATRTLDELWSYYVDHYTHRASTLQRHRDTYEDHIQPVFGNRRLDSIRADEIEKFYKTVQTEQRKAEVKDRRTGEPTGETRLIGGTLGTRIHVQETLQAVLNKGVKAEWINRNPALGIEKPTKPNRKKTARVLTTREVEKLAQEVEAINTRYRALVWTWFETGCRPGEALALRVEDVNHVVHIGRAVKEVTGVRYIEEPKTEASVRDVPISPRLRRELDDHFEAGYANPSDPEALIFTGPNDYGPLSETNLRNRVIAKAAERAGLGKVTPYDLRHSGISYRLQQGFTYFEVAEFTGTSPQMLRKTYGHLNVHTLQEKFDRLSETS